MAIDNPTEKIKEIISEPSDNLLDELIKAGGVASPITEIVDIIRDWFNVAECNERLKAAIFALCDEIDRLRSQVETNVKELVSSQWFRSAVRALLDEASRADDEQQAAQLGRAVARGAIRDTKDEHRRENLASYVRDLSRMGKDDIRMLRVLHETFADVIKHYVNLNSPDQFSDKFDVLKGNSRSAGIEDDDMISLCARLSGFGLAYEVARKTTRQAPNEHCFRPTKRGLYLLSLLDSSGG